MGGDFYTTAAQVIPLMFVAIFFEGRAVWKIDLWRRSAVSPQAMVLIRALQMGLTTFYLVVGEAAALWALGNDAEVRFDSGYPGWLIAWSLGIGGFALIAQAFAPIALEVNGVARWRFEHRGERVAARALLALLVLGGAGVASAGAWLIISSLTA